MEQTGQTDVFILVLVALSVLMGLSRGAFVEVTRLAIYIFSGIFGYYLIPAFRPLFASFIPHEKTVQTLSLLLGAFVAWNVLRIFSSSLIRNVKNSQFQRLDRSLGAVFGLGRGIFFLFVFSFLASAVAPHMLEKSRLLKMSFATVETIMKQYSELDVFSEKNKQKENKAKSEETPLSASADHQDKKEQNSSWKKAVAEYVLNKKVQTKDGEEPLVSVASEIIADGMTFDAGKPIPPEFAEIILRLQLQKEAGNSVLELTPDQIESIFRQKQQQREQNENSGNR